MNNTPTPRTDAIIEQSWRSINFPNSPIPAKFARQLETELAAVTEQRDRLADIVKQFIYILDITEESDSGRLFHPTNITSCRAGDLQKAGQLVEALRRAVKGGADE